MISVFGFPHTGPPPGRMYSVDGLPHCIAHESGERLLRLRESFELVWATGWEERANEHLPHLLGLPEELPTLTFDEAPEWGVAHWKLSAVTRYAQGRPAAWIDDSFDESCFTWAEQRPEPTLLIHTEPATGLGDDHVQQLLTWARTLEGGAAP